MICFYRLAFPFLALLLCPYYMIRMFKRGGYCFKLHFRIGLIPRLQKKSPERKRIWIQAVSVGELSSISKLLDSLISDPKIEVFLTGTTSTALTLSEQRYQGKVLENGPFPIDWWPFSVMAWNTIRPDLVVTVDSELWPEHFHQGRIRGIPSLILNGRLSDRTFQRLRAYPIFRRLLLPEGIEVLATSERQKSRWIELGIEERKVQAVGNLKVDVTLPRRADQAEKSKIRTQFGFDQSSLLIAGISTWPGEDELLVEVLLELLERGVQARLLLIPRHVERRRQIRSLLERKKLSHHLRSEGLEAPLGNLVYLADTTGELPALIQATDLALLGKTIAPNKGGQNPIEPVSEGIPLVLGPNYQNFGETCADLLRNDAILVTETADQAKRELILLAESENLRKTLCQNALHWIESQGSPTEKCLQKVYESLKVPRN